MMPDESPTESKGQPGFISAALSGLCPRCRGRTLFAAPAQVAHACTACGLDFAPLERGGRFLSLVTMVFALLLVFAALGFDEWLRPPLWVTLAVWAPVTVGGVIFGLRLWKTMWAYHLYEEAPK